MDQDKIPTRPVVTSHIAADAQLKQWLEANSLKSLTDAEGTAWSLRVDVSQLPDPQDLHGAIWEIQLGVKTSLDVPTLVSSKVLDEVEDQRLINLIGDARIPMSMRPVRIEAKDIDQARNEFAAALERLRREFPQTAMRDVKRRIIASWLENCCTFGQSGVRP